MTSKSSSKHFLSSHVGIGSRLHEVDGDFIIITLTVSSDTGENSGNEELYESSMDMETSVFDESLRKKLILPYA